jgi:hypothetical protein
MRHDSENFLLTQLFHTINIYNSKDELFNGILYFKLFMSLYYFIINIILH